MPKRTATARSLVTAREVADLLGVTTAWVYEQSRRGRIPTVRLGRYRRYRVEAIEAWIETLEADDGVSPESGGRPLDGRRRKPQRAGSSRHD